MEIVHLKARILLPLALVSTLVLVFFILGLHREQQEHLVEELARSIHVVGEHYRFALEERAGKLGAALEVIAADTALKAAIADNNRDALLSRILPIFQRLKAEHNVTHLYFHDKQRVNFIRAHQPDSYGDKIDRFTAIGAEKTQDLFHGVELGPLGTFTLRAVLPLYEGDKLVGYIELGEEIDQIVQDMEGMFGVDLVVVIGKQYLHQPDWSAGMAMLGRTADWERFPDMAIVSHTSRTLLNGLRDYLSHAVNKLPSEVIEVALNDKQYRGRILTLLDAGERIVGGMVVLRDMTARIQSTRNMMVFISGSALGFGVILFLMFYIILDRVERRQKSLWRGLQEKEHDLLRIIESIPDIIYTANASDNFGVTFVSPALTQILGYTPEEFIANPEAWADSIHEADRERVLAHGRSVIKSTETDYHLEYRMWHKNRKTLRWFEDRFHIDRDSAGCARMLIGVMTDISSRKESEMLAARMGRILEHSWNEIYAFDAETLRFVEVSDGASKNLGYSLEELRHLTPLDLKPELTFDQFEALVEPLRRAEEKQICFETAHRRKDGSQYPVEVRLQLSNLEEPPVFISIIQDISEQKQYIEELEHQALYDALTELPNRSLLLDRLKHALKASHRDACSLSVVVLDILRLKEINDLLGHQCGDFVIKEVATRLKNGLRETDTVARLGGDEFAIVLLSADIKQAEVITRKIHKTFEEPLIVEDMPLELDVAIGVAQYPDHGDSSTVLLQHADIAMRVAKNEASRFSIYNASEDPFCVRRLKLHGEIRKAICDKEIAVYYQPKIDIKTGKIASVEALARWSHPIDGMISPDDFIPMVEQSGLIRPFALFVLEQTIKQIKHWSDAHIDLTVAVNISTRNLLDPSLADSIASLLNYYHVSHDRLTLEITESAIMYRPEQSLKILNHLHTMGLKLSIDDFGTGYSSLAYLKLLPISELKIDYSFVSAICNSEDDKVIVRSTINLAHNMGLRVVAEGVEDSEIMDLLRIYRCDFGQGFYFSCPLPAEELESWLDTSPWGW